MFLKIIKNVVKYIKVRDFRVGYQNLLRCLKKKGRVVQKLLLFSWKKGGRVKYIRIFS